MIINIAKLNEKNLIYRILNSLKLIFIYSRLSQSVTRIYADSRQLNKFFRTKYPRLTRDQDNNIACVSCELCVDICPTNAIKIEKANLTDIPQTLSSGEVPLRFYLNVAECIKCRLCAEVCQVDALELNQDYSEVSVDLIKKQI